MVGGPMKLAVNEFLLRPDALEVVSGLVGTSLGITGIWKIVGNRRLSAGQEAEMELLDENAPVGFWDRAVTSVRSSLLATQMRGGGHSRIGWNRGLWLVKPHGLTWTSDPGFDPSAEAFDLTDIETPVMDKNGILV